MQVSWSPIASWISTAATGESTPPDRPQITRPAPTWARTRAISAARKPAMVQSPAQAGDVVDEVAQQRRAVRRVDDLRMEHHAIEAPRLVGDGGERGALADRDALKPGGSAVTRSPWLIQTCSRAPVAQTPRNRALGSGTST